MSDKGLGQKIAIKFTQDLIGDLDLKNINIFIRPTGVFTASNTVGGHPADNAFDGNINTYWYNYWGGSSQYIQIRLPEKTKITGFRWINNSGYRPKDFKFQGSINGSTWTDILSTTSQNGDGFQTFIFSEVEYEYYRWTILNYYNSYIQLAELELRISDNNKIAFKIEGQQLRYMNGPLINGDYQIESLERHSNSPTNTLLLTMKPFKRFNNVEGDLTISYDATIGNLTGVGGFVENFSVTFEPEDLEKLINPSTFEYFEINADAIIDHIKMDYTYGYHKDIYFEITASAEVSHIDLTIVNP